ncbi:helix-turn-helix domain-containing protein [Bremerella cremea]|uniref:helix-turn-helix domain-containing protein n=1 Tax=Bremerella cremea TaxID=1031537 RepID=UPI0031E67383
MTINKKRLTKGEIASAFVEGEFSKYSPILTTKEAAEMLRVKPKTVNAWKNAGLLEGTYRQQRGEDRYWRDRLIDSFFNGPTWDAT